MTGDSVPPRCYVPNSDGERDGWRQTPDWPKEKYDLCVNPGSGGAVVRRRVATPTGAANRDDAAANRGRQPGKTPGDGPQRAGALLPPTP